MKVAFLNGEFLPVGEAKVSVLDRSFQLGDGLFETIPIYGAQPFLWSEHLARLRAGAELLGIRIPSSDEELAGFTAELLNRNHATDATLRLHLSRGIGQRGYSPAGAESPTLAMTLHERAEPNPPFARGWRLSVASFPIPSGAPFSSAKTASKVLHVLARAEVERRQCDEALLVNPAGHLVEGAGSNVFWIEGQTVCTPPLSAGALSGVTRGWIWQSAPQLGFPVVERLVEPTHLLQSEGVFLTLSTLGLVPAISLDRLALPESKLVRRLQTAYGEAISKR